jgi:hypothetical protein
MNPAITYRLRRDSVNNTPALFRALRQLYRTDPGRAVRVLCEAFEVQAWIAEALLSGAISHRIEADAVAYELNSAPIINLADYAGNN